MNVRDIVEKYMEENIFGINFMDSTIQLIIFISFFVILIIEIIIKIIIKIKKYNNLEQECIRQKKYIIELENRNNQIEINNLNLNEKLKEVKNINHLKLNEKNKEIENIKEELQKNKSKIFDLERENSKLKNAFHWSKGLDLLEKEKSIEYAQNQINDKKILLDKKEAELKKLQKEVDDIFMKRENESLKMILQLSTGKTLAEEFKIYIKENIQQSLKILNYNKRYE